MKKSTVLILVFLISAIFSSILLGQSKTLQLYGYGDLIYRDVFEREFPNGAKENEPHTFSLLRTHLLISSVPVKRLRMFINIRFQNAAFVSYERLKGEIELFEGWFQYSFSRYLNVRGGKFISPFGYFNAIHVASPSYNTVVLPLMFEDDFIHKAGSTIIPPNSNLEIFGDYRIGDMKFGYNVFVGNGTNPDKIDGGVKDVINFDFNNNKGIGFRLSVNPINNLGSGFSFYTEKSTFNVIPMMDMEQSPMGKPPVLKSIAVDENRKTIGFDLRYSPGDFEIRGEYIRTSIDITGGAYAKMFYYINLNYTLFNVLTPFFELNVYKDPTHFVFRSELKRYTVGAAYRLNSFITIKAEFHDHQFGHVGKGENFGQFIIKQPAKDFKSFRMVWIGVSFLFI